MVVSGSEAVPIQLQFSSLSKLHQGFFLRDSGILALGQDLASCGDAVFTVEVAYDQEALRGRVVGFVPQGTPGCAPTRTGDGLDLRPMSSAAGALAKYRDDVAGRSDYRIANFEIAVRTETASGSCRFDAGGQNPPDGSTFQPCVLVGEERVCVEGVDPKEGVLRLASADPAVVQKLHACL